MHKKWNAILSKELQSQDFINLQSKLEADYSSKIIYPPKDLIFNSFIDPELIKAVIIGQDPYHGAGQAQGLSFSVPNGIKPPPSLLNIYKEIEMEFGYKMNRSSGNLSFLVEQGVMLLNSTLTVEKDKPNSHKDYGWCKITDAAIHYLSSNFEGLVFLLWGAFAQQKESLVDTSKHLILKSPHPSPFSAHKGFFGNNHFILTNEFLKQQQKTPIDWKNH